MSMSETEQKLLKLNMRLILEQLRDGKIDYLSNFVRRLRAKNISPAYHNIIFLEEHGFLQRLSEKNASLHYFKVTEMGMAALNDYIPLAPAVKRDGEIYGK